MKNTSVTPSATFDQMPSPNHTAKIGARITRGIAFIGLDVRVEDAPASRRERQPQADARPSTVPITNASTVSSSVTPRCR